MREGLITAGPPRGPVLRDVVDRALAEWGAAQPDLDYSPFDVVSRLWHVAAHVDDRVEAMLADFGLTRTVVKVLATLRRQGPPYRLSQRALMDHLRLTSATISVRVDQLVELGLVTRAADPTDKSECARATDRGRPCRVQRVRPRICRHPGSLAVCARA